MSDAAPASRLFEPDSAEYDILAEAVALAPAEGIFCEIGLRRGGGIKVILDGVAKRGMAATVLSLDCYGHMPYMVTEDHRDDFDYHNAMRDETLPGIYEYVRGKRINFVFFNLEDTEFFRRFADGVPIYANKGKKVVNEYAFVHFDGQHTLGAVLTATRFILNGRYMAGTSLCYDDIEGYDHQQVEAILLHNGYETIRKGGKKAAYRRAP